MPKTVEEMRAAKTELEMTIAREITEFEDKYDVHVRGVDLCAFKLIGSTRRHTQSATLDLTI